MENTLKNLKSVYPNMPRDVLKLIYKYCIERSRVLIKYGLSRDMQEIIEARMCLASELSSLFCNIPFFSTVFYRLSGKV